MEFVHHGVPGQRRVIGFDVELERVGQAVPAQERDAVGGVEIILMDGRFLGLGLDQKLPAEPDLALVFDGEVKEFRQVVEFALEVGVVEIGVALAAAPEDVVLAAEFLGHFETLLHLGGGVGEDVGVAARRGAVHEAAVREEVRGAPEELDAGPLLFALQHLGDLVEVRVGLLEVFAFGGDVAVVEAVVGGAELLDELEGDLHALLGHLDGIGAVFPGADVAAGAERIGAGASEGVPVADGEAEVVLHGLPLDDFARIVMAKRERVFRIRAFVLDLFDFGEEWHGGHLGEVAGWFGGYDTRKRGRFQGGLRLVLH